MDKLLHEHWRIHKADIIFKEQSVTNEKVDEILKVHPGLSRSLSTKARNVKQATVEHNLVRLQKKP